MDIPHFASEAEATAAGYLIRLPRNVPDYRGWMIGTDYCRGRMRLFGRERSGRWDYPDNPAAPFRVGMCGTIKTTRMASPSGKAPIFRWIKLPWALQPREDLIRVDGMRDRVGGDASLCKFAHLSEWERVRNEIMRRVDVKLDGRADVDLIER